MSPRMATCPGCLGGKKVSAIVIFWDGDPNEPCPTCSGTGEVPVCAACNGSGVQSFTQGAT